MIITYNDSQRNALILARSGDRLRIAQEHCKDAVELRLTEGTWWSEEQQPVSLDFLTAEEIPLIFSQEENPQPALTYLVSRYSVGNAAFC